jgi:hypothetical protein
MRYDAKKGEKNSRKDGKAAKPNKQNFSSKNLLTDPRRTTPPTVDLIRNSVLLIFLGVFAPWREFFF